MVLVTESPSEVRDALTYEKAIQEAKSYLGINEDNQDPESDLWEVE
jgi:hypothetical protein